MSNIKTKQYVEILYPGSFLPEEETRPIESRNPEAVLRSLSKRAFGFRFFERQETKALDGEVLGGVARGYSPYFYVGREFTTEEVVRLYPGDEHRTLRFNLTDNHCKRAVLCRTGNWRPLNDGDVVFPEGR